MKNVFQKKLAVTISTILNPGILAFILLIIAVVISPMSPIETFCWIVAIFVLNGIVPGMLYLFYTSRGYVFDDTLHNKKVHQERVLLFGTFLVLIAAELLILVNGGHFYQPFLAILISGAFAIVIAGAISYFWKMSMHSTMVTFFVLSLMIMFGYDLWLLVILIPLIWWARIYLHRHTIWQLVGGCVFSIIIVLAVFAQFRILPGF